MDGYFERTTINSILHINKCWRFDLTDWLSILIFRSDVARHWYPVPLCLRAVANAEELGTPMVTVAA